MPLVIYKRSNRTHAVLPITLKTSTSLIIALIYLQILYLVSFLSKPFWSSAREFPPYKRNIERWERSIIDIIIAIVPFSNYRSPNPSAVLQSDLLLPGHRSHNTTYSSTSHVNLDGIPLMPPKAASSAFVYPLTLPQCYPEMAIERLTPVMAITERSELKLDLKGGGIGTGTGTATATASGSTITKPGPVVDRYGRNGDPVYDTVKKPVTVTDSGSKSRSPGGSRHRTGINTSGTGSGTGTGTGTGADIGNTPLLGSQHSHTPSRSQTQTQTQSQSHATRSTPSLPHLAKEYTVNMNMNPSQSIEEEQDEDLGFQPLHQVHNLSALMRPSMSSFSHLPNTPRPSQKSPVHSLDGPHDVVSAAQSVFTAKSEDEDDEVETRTRTRSGSGSFEIDGIKLERATKCRSTESYPGKFPVSEGQDFSSLATAEYAFRERGTVTVRPFSDY